MCGVVNDTIKYYKNIGFAKRFRPSCVRPSPWPCSLSHLKVEVRDALPNLCAIIFFSFYWSHKNDNLKNAGVHPLHIVCILSLADGIKRERERGVYALFLKHIPIRVKVIGTCCTYFIFYLVLIQLYANIFVFKRKWNILYCLF